MVTLNLANLADKLVNQKWLMSGTVHGNLCTLVESYLKNPDTIPSYEEKEFKVQGGLAPNEEKNLTAIINVSGILVKGASEIEEELLGLVNTDFIASCIDDALADDEVSDICLIFNSPGGQSTGIEELGRKIAYADTVKPTVAWTETSCDSAAYWLASQARTIGMTPSAKVGSVGVYCLVKDLTEAMKKEGVTIDAISSGKFKLMGHSFKKLTDEERAMLQESVTSQHEQFKNVILAKRTIAAENLEGQTFDGVKALQNGFVDVLVDDLNAFFTTINIKNMKSFNKVDSSTGLTTLQEAAAAIKTVASSEPLPAVPGATEKVEEKKNSVMCPHCSKEFEVVGYVKADEPDKLEAVKPEPAKEEPKAEPKAEEPKKEEPVKPEVKEEEPKKDDKKEMATKPITFAQALGVASIETKVDPFYMAALTMQQS